MNIASIAIVGVLLAFVQGTRADHAPLPQGTTPLAATWLWGHHSIPESISRDGSPYVYAYPHTDPARIVDPPWTEIAARHVKPGARAPAVVFLHGCSGLIRGGTGYRALLLQMGFAVFEPDAYARPGHSCANSNSGQRREEAAYALARIRELPWIDRDRVVLIGFSQGGRAANMWDEPGYAAIVILAAPVNPAAPVHIPVLAVAGSDESFAHPTTFVVTRSPPSRAILIEDGGHEIISHPEFKSTLRAFLDEVVPAR